MEHFAGLDVSVNETSVCIVDETGRIVREAKVASEPDALLPVINKGKRMVGMLALGDVGGLAPNDLLSEYVKSVSAHH